MQTKRLTAAWSEDYLEKVFTRRVRKHSLLGPSAVRRFVARQLE
jgi:hypothetical protein